MYQAVLLDFDNTIYPYSPSHEKAMDRVYDYLHEHFGLSSDDAQIRYDQARQTIHKRLNNTAASHHRLLYFQSLLEDLNKSVLQHAQELDRLYWETFIEHISVHNGVLDFLELLKIKNIKVCLLTDLVMHVQLLKLKKYSNITSLIDFIVTSEEIGCEKPHSDMFLAALKKLNLKAKDVCMIGDHWHKDIQGAIACGIDAFWFSSDDLPEKTGQVTRFDNFQNLIEILNI